MVQAEAVQNDDTGIDYRPIRSSPKPEERVIAIPEGSLACDWS
jgi:hypothetical protein